MGQLVFQANSGGQTNLVGQNTASTFNLNIPLANGTLVSTGDTATVTSAMISGPVTTAKGGTGLTSFTSGGAVYATSTSALTTGTLPTSAGGTNLTSFTANGVLYASSSSALTTGSALTFDGTNLGVGGLSSGVRLDVYGSITARSGTVTADAYTNYGTNLTLNSGGSLPMLFQLNGSEQMRLDTSGNLLVGTTSNLLSARLVVGKNNSSTLAFFSQDYSAGNADNVSFANGFASGSNNAVQCRFYNNDLVSVGSITSSGSATLYNATSDYRLKTVTGVLAGHGERIDLLEPVEYIWKPNGLNAKGFLAHKFQEVYPSSVTGFKDEVDAEGNPVYQAMQSGSSEVIADLVAEIQSLRKRLAALEAK